MTSKDMAARDLRATSGAPSGDPKSPAHAPIVVKSMGYRLYAACQEAFGLRGDWDPSRKPITCENYAKAARAFARDLRVDEMRSALLETRRLVSEAALSGFADEAAIRAIFVNNGAITRALGNADVGRQTGRVPSGAPDAELGPGRNP